MFLCNVLTNEPEFSQLSIIFKYEHDNHERLFTFQRSQTEPLEVLVKRMKINLQKAFNNGKIGKKKNVENNDNFIITFIRHNKTVNLNLENKDFWQDGSEMHINGKFYFVRVNYPNIIDLRLSNIILTGYFAYPYLEITNGNISDSEFTWYIKDNFKDHGEWKIISKEFLYEVKQDDLGCLLKVVCKPKQGNKEGITKEAISPKSISKGPINCPFDKNFIHTKTLQEPNQFRIVSYNLLADLYANSDYSRDVLYYCKSSYLNFEYRRSLLLKELIGYNSDIYFLQELDLIFYKKALEPIFNSIGLGSYFVAKESNSEGICIFYHKSKFDCLKKEAHTYSDLLCNYELFKTLKSKVEENKNLLDRIKKLKNTFQIVVLQSTLNRNNLLLLCNLHLYSKDDADHIRLIQTIITLKYIEKCLDELLLNKNYSNCKLSTILSGDFNSTPEFGVVKLIKTKRIDSSVEDFKSNKLEIIEDFYWEHILNFETACGFPNYTHYAQHFHGCLDYIFYDPINLKVIEVVPMADHEEVIKEIALPNEKIPSDHLPLICTLAWNF